MTQTDVEQINRMTTEIQDSLIIYRNTGPRSVDKYGKLAVHSAMGACHMMSRIEPHRWNVAGSRMAHEICDVMLSFHTYLENITKISQTGDEELSTFWHDTMWFFAMCASTTALILKVHDNCREAVTEGGRLSFPMSMELLLRCASDLVDEVLYKMNHYNKHLVRTKLSEDFTREIMWQMTMWPMKTREILKYTIRKFRIESPRLHHPQGRTPSKVLNSGLFARFDNLHDLAVVDRSWAEACASMVQWMEDRIEYPAFKEYNLFLHV